MRAHLTAAIADVTPVKYQNAPPLIGTDINGSGVAIQYRQDRRPTVVFTFSVNCGYCNDYWRTVNSLQALAPGKLRLVFIDTQDGPGLRPGYLAAHGVHDEPVLVGLTAESALRYGTRILPMIELLNGDGRVEWTHVGELAHISPTNLASQIEKFIPAN